MKYAIVCGVGLCGLLAAGQSHAQKFGSDGQVVVSSDFEISFTSTSESLPDDAPAGTPDPESTTTIVLAPAADYFIASGFSVGAQIVYASSSQGDFSASAFGFGPRIGFGMAINETVSIFPRLAFLYSSTSSDFGMGMESSGSSTAIALFAPIQFHPAEHFFIGIGPVFDMQLSNSAEVAGVEADQGKQTSIGVASVVGGYFGG